MLDDRERHRLAGDVGIGPAFEHDPGALESLHGVAANVVVAAGFERRHGVAPIEGDVDVVPRLELAVIGEGLVAADFVHPAGERDGIVGMGRAGNLGREAVDGGAGLGIEMGVGDGGDDFVAAGVPGLSGGIEKGEEEEREQEARHVLFMPEI